MEEGSAQQFKAVARNALTWGIAWGLAGGAIVGLLSLVSPGPGVESLLERIGVAILSALGWGIRFGLAGAVIGTAFSAVIRFGYRGRRLADISPVRFGLLGAVVGGVGVPLYLQLMNVLTDGRPIAWNLVTDDAVWASVFGAVVASGSILLARRGAALPAASHSSAIEEGGHPDSSLAAGLSDEPTSEPSHRARS